MYVDEVVALFKQYISEPINSFMSDADYALYLKMAHNLIRADLALWRPTLINTRVVISPAAETYDLADAANPVRLMGPAPTHDQLLSISKITGLGANGRPATVYHSAGSEAELFSSGFGARYYLEGSVLYFSGVVGQNLEITYVPYSNIDWANQTPGAMVFIDNFVAFHDLIALEAAKKYMIRDGEINPALMQEYTARKSEFDAFLTMAGDAGSQRGASSRALNYWD